MNWVDKVCAVSKGYDTLAWAGFVTGLKALSNNEERWTCAELPYWMLQDNGYRLTPKDEAFIYPRFFRFSPMFE